jgi:hypothetical protein
MLDMSNMKDVKIKGVIVAHRIYGACLIRARLTWKMILLALLSRLFGYPHLLFLHEEIRELNILLTAFLDLGKG